MKKSSADKESGNLEEVFRHRFGEAEATPTGDLWGRIGAQLDQAEEIGRYKKRLAFFKRMAIFCALLLLVGGAWLYTSLTNQTAGNLAANQSQSQPADAVTSAKIAANSAPPETSSQTLPAETGIVATTENTSGNQPGTNEFTSADPGQITNQPISHSGQQTINNTASSLAKTSSKPRTGINSNANNAASSLIAHNRNITPKANSTPVSTGKSALNARENGAGVTSPATGVNNTESPIAGNEDQPKDRVSDGSPAINQQLISDNDQQGSAIQPETAISKPATELAVLPVVSDTANSAEIAPLPEKASMRGRWSYGFWYAGYQFDQGLVVNNSVADNTPYAVAYRKAAQEFNELTHAAPSNRVEARAGYWLHNRWRLDAGLSFSRNRAITVNTFVLQNFIHNAEMGEMEMVGQTSIIEPVFFGTGADSVAVVSGPAYETHYQYDYLAIPVRLMYQSDRQGFHWFASGGFSAAYLVNSKLESTRPQNTTFSQDLDLRKLNFAGLFSFGLGYQINDAFSLQAGPDLSYSLNSLISSDKAGVRQANPYTLGITGGFTYTFK